MFKVILPLQSYLRNTAFRKFSSHLSSTAPRVKTEFSSIPLINLSLRPYHRSFSSTFAKMSDLTVELTAPNGKKYIQPTGLFINNEWVKSSTGQKITSINPSYVTPTRHVTTLLILTLQSEMNQILHQYMLLPQKMSIPQSKQLEQPCATPNGAICPPPIAVPS